MYASTFRRFPLHILLDRTSAIDRCELAHLPLWNGEDSGRTPHRTKCLERGRLSRGAHCDRLLVCSTSFEEEGPLVGTTEKWQWMSSSTQHWSLVLGGQVVFDPHAPAKLRATSDLVAQLLPQISRQEPTTQLVANLKVHKG